MSYVTVLGDGSGWSHDHGWFWFWPLIPLFWLLVFFLVARLFFWRGGRGPWGGRQAAAAGPDPRAILAERYARGEISHEVYRERLSRLEE